MLKAIRYLCAGRHRTSVELDDITPDTFLFTLASPFVRTSHLSSLSGIGYAWIRSSLRRALGSKVARAAMEGSFNACDTMEQVLAATKVDGVRRYAVCNAKSLRVAYAAGNPQGRGSHFALSRTRLTHSSMPVSPWSRTRT